MRKHYALLYWGYAQKQMPTVKFDLFDHSQHKKVFPVSIASVMTGEAGIHGYTYKIALYIKNVFNFSFCVYKYFNLYKLVKKM